MSKSLTYEGIEVRASAALEGDMTWPVGNVVYVSAEVFDKLMDNIKDANEAS